MEAVDPTWMIALVAVVGLIAGFLVLRSRRKSNPDIDSRFLESRQMAEYPQTQLHAPPVRPAAASPKATPLGDLLGDINEDPVTGASILSQSGRLKQAEQVLIRASLASPGRNDTLLALLDLYISTRDEKGVTGVMCLIQRNTDGAGAEWARAARAFEKSGIKWSDDMQKMFEGLVEKARSNNYLSDP